MNNEQESIRYRGPAVRDGVKEQIKEVCGEYERRGESKGIIEGGKSKAGRIG